MLVHWLGAAASPAVQHPLHQVHCHQAHHCATTVPQWRLASTRAVLRYKGAGNERTATTSCTTPQRPAVVRRRSCRICCSASSVWSPAPSQGPQMNESEKRKKLPGILLLIQRWQEWWRLEQAESHALSREQFGAILKKLYNLIKPDAMLIWVGLVCMVIAALSELTIPQLMSSSLYSLAQDNAAANFSASVKYLAVASVSYGVFAGMRGWIFSIVNTNLLQRLREAVFNRIVEQEMSFFETEEVGVLTSRLGSDCQVIARLFSTNLNVALRNAVQLVGGMLYLCYLCPALAASCSVVSLMLWIVAARYGDFSRACMRAYQDKLANTNAVAEEVFSSMGVVRSSGTEGFEQHRYLDVLLKLRYVSLRAGAAYCLYLIANSILYNMNNVVTLFVGGILLSRGAVTGAQLMTFVLYVDTVDSASLAVCDQWGPFMEAMGASERILEYLDRPKAPQLSPGRKLDTCKGHLQLRDVSFTYVSWPEHVALQDVNIAVPAGTTMALVGRSGGGKSTLMALLHRMYDPNTGQVLLDGVDLRELDSGWLRDQIAIVDQQPTLFTMTVAENIAYGCKGVSQDDIIIASKAANAHDFISALPEGYNSRVTNDLLSGGQRQRIVIARALVKRPRVLLLDEATSALDADSEQAVQRAISTAMKALGCTVVVIAHRLSTVVNADQIVVMSEGRVAEIGRHAQLLRKGGIYAQLIKKQQGGVSGVEQDMAPHAPPPHAPPHTHHQEAAAGDSGEAAHQEAQQVTGSIEGSVEEGDILPARASHGK